MTKEELFNLNIDAPDKAVFMQVKKNWDKISKPLDSLGDFEDVICKIGAIQNSSAPSTEYPPHRRSPPKPAGSGVRCSLPHKPDSSSSVPSTVFPTGTR